MKIRVLILAAILSAGLVPGSFRIQALGRAGNELFDGPCMRQDGRPQLEQLLLADSYLEAGRAASRILAGPAPDIGSQAVCGLALLKSGRITEAEALFAKVLDLDPGNAEAHLGLGRIARIRNDTDDALDHLRRAVRSEVFYGDAFRQLWRAAWDRGQVAELREVRALAAERYALESETLPSWIANGIAQLDGLSGKRILRMEGPAVRFEVPLVQTDAGRRIRMISLQINGRGGYLFHLDSALVDFMTISPLLAEELGLAPVGRATSTGVGTATIDTRFARLDEVRLGPLIFHDVPVMVSDVRTLRGLREGLVGTAFLKRFNATIDVEAGVLDLYPLERPDLLAARIDRAAVAADVPLYVFDQTVVEASLEGAPPALYMLDSAAATNLVDAPFFAEHIKPKLDPARIVRRGIRGAGGGQFVNQVEGLTITLGPLVLGGQQANEFPMAALNAIGGRYLAGLLGNPVLWPYRVHMDFRNGRLILERRPADAAKAGAGAPGS
jgi:hypothetical protein